jgi:hypothetical protein
MGIPVDGDVLSTEAFVGDGKNFTNDDATLLSHRWRAAYAQATFCATRSLLRPTAAMLALLDETLTAATHSGDVNNGTNIITTSIGGAVGTAASAAVDSAEPFVIGMHVRFGGKWQDRMRARDTDALKIIQCAWNMTSLRSAQTGECLSKTPFTFARFLARLRLPPP